jgi:hypothetical protein
MSLKVAYRNWSAEGMPHVQEYEADSWSFTGEHFLVVRSGHQIVATVAAGEWIAIWDPATLVGAAPAAPTAAKGQKAAPPQPAPEAAPPAAPVAPPAPAVPPAPPAPAAG